MVTQRRRLRVTGTVQGVGFRPFVYRHAVELGLGGHVANDSKGVVIEVEGPPDRLDELARRLAEEPPPLAHIATVETTSLASTQGANGFHIVDSRVEGAPAVAVSVDVATCADCLAELHDPADRRFEYPFINCTNCGPRYTIIRSIPYDRASTTMASFPMCEDCRREYEDPADRRFHAEPNACPACGPQLHLVSPGGTLLAGAAEALDGAAKALEAGQVLAVKGLGGYHLAVDAGNEAAVAELRRRKARDDKPFALMVPDLDAARSLCQLSVDAEHALASPRRPIVLAPRRPGERAAGGVAPRLPELGLMLPYTPLHDLLLRRVPRPLVMTSGNLSDEPIAHDDTDAVTRLGPMVDAILGHDRAIHIRCDDSVVRARPHRVQMVRRSRGYAPEPIALPAPARRLVLAVGAELKSTVAVAKGQNIVASHHIGDLEHLAAYRSFLQAVDHLCRLTGVDPEVVAHDLHPEYLSTKFALELDLPTLGVQHHHAHIASCLVEHGRTDTVLGVAFDGLGLGECGRLWGGEFLVADLHGYRRVGHLREVPLPGGDRAAKEPWRMAMAWAHAALGPAEAERYGRHADERWRAVLSLVEHPETPTTSSGGRLFDAVAGLVGLRLRATYEGQAPIELEAAATEVPLDVAPVYPVEVRTDEAGMTVLDPSVLVATVVAERDRGTPLALLSAGFHAGLGRGVAELAVRLARGHGLGTVALSGGVFQNARLTEVVVPAVEASGLEVLVHSRIPPNDGGVSIGQAAIAAVTTGSEAGSR
ncbi:MAG: carbamoyltransferase HypF [Actinomycetota bacterium]|nr:carbamoyltransferase HypF [Actinomycetota bacterium]